MYAVVETGGKQYKLAEGDVVKVEKLSAEAGEKVVLSNVIMVIDDEGNVNLTGDAKVTVEVIEQGRGKKIVVYKYKKRKNYRRKQGHRQSYTKVKVEKIEA